MSLGVFHLRASSSGLSRALNAEASQSVADRWSCVTDSCQDESTLDCAVLFTGTNDFAEMFTSTVSFGTGFCGFSARQRVWPAPQVLGKIRWRGFVMLS